MVVITSKYKQTLADMDAQELERELKIIVNILHLNYENEWEMKLSSIQNLLGKADYVSEKLAAEKQS